MEYKPKHKFKLDLSEVEQTTGESFVHIDCPSCGTQVPADDLELNSKIAKCSSCNALFPIDKKIDELKLKSSKATVFKQPIGVEKFYFGDELDLSTQQTPTGLEIVAVMIAPLFGLITFMAYMKGKMVLYPSVILFLISAYFIFSLINLKKHRTHVRVSSKDIFVEHRPKKGRKDIYFNARDIEQLYVYKFTDMNGAQVYGVKVVFNEGNGQKHEKLIGGIKTIREAKFIEQEIENYLNLPNEVMIEEVNNA